MVYVVKCGVRSEMFTYRCDAEARAKTLRDAGEDAWVDEWKI